MRSLTVTGFAMDAMTPVGYIRSPFADKFGVPRQPRLAPHARAELQLLPPFDHPDCVRGLDGYSHVWLTFVFHAHLGRGWKPLVRPPRLGGNDKLGVFASRSTFRPNPLGLSLVELLAVEPGRLLLAGADLVDGTPVLDIKPYIPFSDSVAGARCDWVPAPPPTLPLRWTPLAAAQLAQLADRDLAALIGEVLTQDPRPAFHDDPARIYGVRLASLDVRFRVDAGGVEVVELVDAGTTHASKV
ncbi:tRNA (N6-threonylcarbamoyladenosine(37)-N6)-methyltransferase TrmO [Laribacter hongkongensis]|nr:tRNA (N6-threonylcarbamoyladenosine(37)-N6)-methyltransferase TrmO [Laribacter hongkongensis]MCG9040088.1 tRNA (N6-threonylcarbamoyladenosine(37)-N6)-methyltransferase TrmO [Laribacter hongkongensis]MCG9089942.1 tRNA (N6-threonylcarbamoyladenosine(37)-N6)-methyltransferase TrmO [Laribacter hongkongensis]MCG9098728.1 tRNA (N6-threonylcarbamoyladenosine(37)-N6)-methyltransferase TrmO [Laribacter hongkongensis]